MNSHGACCPQIQCSMAVIYQCSALIEEMLLLKKPFLESMNTLNILISRMSFSFHGECLENFMVGYSTFIMWPSRKYANVKS